jgi:hypothetical protein
MPDIASKPPHPLPVTRERVDPPKTPVVETNYQRLRALLAWLNYPELASAVELGVSRDLLRTILNGTSLPDLDFQQRVYVMSRRWPHGLINIADWPAPAPVRKRGPKGE